MNKAHVLFHLKEAADALSSMINEIESDVDYGLGNFRPDMSHLYHHINTAWNARDVTDLQAEECTESDFENWQRMPEAQEFLL